MVLNIVNFGIYHYHMVMNWENALRLRHIRCFLEVARVESVSLAATHLNITQPAVSKTLKELETLLNTRLFDRVGRELRLNEQGRIFQSHAAASLTELSRAHDRLGQAAQSAVQLTIGVLPTAATELVPLAAIEFHRAMPHARLNVRTGPNWLLYNQMRDGQLDLVVGRMPEAGILTGLTFEQLYTEDVVLITRPDHPLLTSTNQGAELVRFPMILPPKGAVIRGTVERYLTSIGLRDAQGVFETVALPFGRKVVQSTDMIWFISRGVVQEEIKQGSVAAINLGSALLAGPVGIFLSQNAIPNAARSVLVDHLRTIAQRLQT